MAAGKWITDLPPGASYVDAARHVLTVRLETVRHFLDSTLGQVDKDPEYVHQLRVGTRRARAALDVFDDCLPKKIGQKTNRCLRKLRRAAGHVRDWDVFLQGLHGYRDNKNRRLRPALDLINGLALAQRDAARTKLFEASSDQPFAFERLITKTLSALKQPSNGEVVHLGDVALPFLLARIDELRKTANAAVDDSTQLHRVRILGKRLRYAMEIFGDCFAQEFKERVYPAIEQMQERLGLMHDSDVASRHLLNWRERSAMIFAADWPRYRPGFDVLIKNHQDLVASERKKFWTTWQQWEETDGSALLENLLLEVQRGEFVSIAGNDKTAPGGRDGLKSPADEEVGRMGTVGGLP